MSEWKRRQLDRLWMTHAQWLNRAETEAAGGRWHQADVYYRGGGVYRCSFGSSVRGASAARTFIERLDPKFAMRVSHAAGLIDRTNGGAS